MTSKLGSFFLKNLLKMVFLPISSILTFLASTKKPGALSYMLTKSAAMAQVYRSTGLWPETEFLGEIYSKTPLQLCLEIFFLQTHATSYSFSCALMYTVKEKGGKPERKSHPYGLRNPYRNFKLGKLSRSCSETSKKSYVREFSFWMSKLIRVVKTITCHAFEHDMQIIAKANNLTFHQCNRGPKSTTLSLVSLVKTDA